LTPKSCGPDNTIKIRGDWRETMSTKWFHDHMLDYTAQNVYKGNAAMMNIYSGIDRGLEEGANNKCIIRTRITTSTSASERFGAPLGTATTTSTW